MFFFKFIEDMEKRILRETKVRKFRKVKGVFSLYMRRFARFGTICTI